MICIYFCSRRLWSVVDLSVWWKFLIQSTPSKLKLLENSLLGSNKGTSHIILPTYKSLVIAFEVLKALSSDAKDN